MQYIQFVDGTQIEARNLPINKISAWQMMKSYINVFYRYREDHIITRKQILRKFEKHGYISNENRKHWTIDTYRNYLYKAGYLDYVIKENGKKKLGHYRIIKEIPTDLSVDDVRQEAYGSHLPFLSFGDTAMETGAISAATYYYDVDVVDVVKVRANEYEQGDEVNINRFRYPDKKAKRTFKKYKIPKAEEFLSEDEMKI